MGEKTLKIPEKKTKATHRGGILRVKKKRDGLVGVGLGWKL